MGVDKVDWLSDPDLALWSVSLVAAWASLPFAVLILRGGLLSIPQEVFEAAAIDGAGPFRLAFRVVLPLLRPTLMVLVILVVLYAFRSFDFVYVMTSGGPGTVTTTLPFLAYQDGVQDLLVRNRRCRGDAVDGGGGAARDPVRARRAARGGPGVRGGRQGPVARAFTIALGLVYLLPLLWIALTAFKSDRDVLSRPNAVVFTPTLAAFSDVIDIASTSVLTSLKISVATTLLVLVVAVPAAYALARRVSDGWARVSAAVLGLFLVLQMVPQPMAVIPLYGILADWRLVGSAVRPRPRRRRAAGAVRVAPAAALRAGDPQGGVRGRADRRRRRRQDVPRHRRAAAGERHRDRGRRSSSSSPGASSSTPPRCSPIRGELPVSGLLAQQTSLYSVSWNRLMGLALLTSLPLLAVFLVAKRRLVEGLSVGAVK